MICTGKARIAGMFILAWAMNCTGKAGISRLFILASAMICTGKQELLDCLYWRER